ncbi:MAG TPA: tetratricopeptide repeat protein, partial [Vicinamibacterales bacterium]|nr:tetratricopeptide repeat protein [Vicinamibacterales bacterium]
MKKRQPIVSLRLRAAAFATLALVSAACGTPETRKQGYFERGNRYAAEKQYDHAIVEYANAIRLDPKFGEARLKLAEAYE